MTVGKKPSLACHKLLWLHQSLEVTECCDLLVSEIGWLTHLDDVAVMLGLAGQLRGQNPVTHSAKCPKMATHKTEMEQWEEHAAIPMTDSVPHGDFNVTLTEAQLEWMLLMREDGWVQTVNHSVSHASSMPWHV